MKIEMEIGHGEQINLSIAALNRAIKRRPQLGCDGPALISVRGILEGVKAELATRGTRFERYPDDDLHEEERKYGTARVRVVGPGEDNVQSVPKDET